MLGTTTWTMPPKKKAAKPSPTFLTTSDGNSSSDDCLDMLEEGLEDEPLDFLARLNPNSLGNFSKKQKRLQRKRPRSLIESEAEFETHPRTSNWTEEEKEFQYFLPLKADNGRLIYQPPLVKEQSEQCEQCSEEVDGDSTQESDVKQPVASTPLTVAELFTRRQKKLTERKEKIAELASGLVEDPETNISNLKRLRDLCTERDPDVAISIRKLATVSLTSVFKDITPSYHIRELTDAEKAVKVKKEVKKLRNFEEGLLTNYQGFLSVLDDTVKFALKEGGVSHKKSRRERNKPVNELDGGQTLSREAMESLGGVALNSLCQLLLSLPHFNFRNNLIAVLVPRMASKEREISQLCCETMEKLFKNDQIGDVSLEAVKLISKLVKSKSYNTKPAILDTLLHLGLSAVDEPVGAGGPLSSKDKKKKDASKLSKKQRKLLKEEKQLNRDLQEASAIESRDKRNKMQTELLSVVFTMYFRILKHSRHSPLLRPVLRGLAKFAHLISVDFFSDLMSVLHSLAETGGLSNRECMQCVSTAFEILSGQGAALNIDPRQFYVQLYGSLLQLNTNSSSEDLLLAVECMDKLIRKRRQISLLRVLAFVKRLATISLQLLPGACLAVLATIRAFMQSYRQTEQLLDTESIGGAGVFRPDIPDPEMCHASSTLLWELTVFRRHYCGVVCSYSTHLLAGAPSQGRGALNGIQSRKSPAEFIKEFPNNGFESDDVMRRVPVPQPHPWNTQRSGRSEYHYYTDKGLSPLILTSEHKADQVCEQLFSQYL